MKKKLFFGISTCILALGIAGGASAAGSWSAEATLDLPGDGSGVYGADKGVPNKTKESSDVKASFHGISKTSSWASHGKIVDTKKNDRSGLILISPGTTASGSTTASNGSVNNVKAFADTWQVGTDSIRFKWSPDSPK